MMNVINQVAYLRTSREFPEDLHQLSVEVNRSYIDVANAVNVRTIGLFPVNRCAITGESWYFTTSRQQALRQVYEFGTIAPGATLNIPYRDTGFNRLIRLFGTVLTAVPNYRTIPFSSATVVTDNIQVTLDHVNTQIIIVNGATAPSITSGFIVYEWLSQS